MLVSFDMVIAECIRFFDVQYLMFIELGIEWAEVKSLYLMYLVPDDYFGKMTIY